MIKLFKFENIQNKDASPIYLNNLEINILPTVNYDNKHFIYINPIKQKKNTSNLLLSKREEEIFNYILKGYTNKVIADKLWITINTVKKHLSNMYEKIGVSNRTELIYKLQK